MNPQIVVSSGLVRITASQVSDNSTSNDSHFPDPGRHEPGRHWNYSSGTTNNLTAILGEIVARMSVSTPEQLLDPDHSSGLGTHSPILRASHLVMIAIRLPAISTKIFASPSAVSP